MADKKKRQRRAFRKLVRDTARQAAHSCRDYDSRGRLVRLTDPRALAVLERGFSRLLQANCTPQVLQLSRAEGLAFPRQEAAQIPQSAKAWLAVGIDPEHRATYALRWMGGPFPDPLTERAVAEALMLAELEQHVSFAGFPAGGGA